MLLPKMSRCYSVKYNCVFIVKLQMNANKNTILCLLTRSLNACCLSFILFLCFFFFFFFHFIHINVSDLVKEINRITKFYGVNVKKMKRTTTMTAWLMLTNKANNKGWKPRGISNTNGHNENRSDWGESKEKKKKKI